MISDPFERLLAEVHARTVVDLRAALRDAGTPVLQKVAVDVVPLLFRAGYRGDLAATGEHWADAWARPAVTGLPVFLVRVHHGTFTSVHAANLEQAMHGGRVEQAALIVISDAPVRPDVRASLASAVPWFLDLDGLVNLLMHANVGIAIKTYEAKYVDPGYFR